MPVVSNFLPTRCPPSSKPTDSIGDSVLADIAAIIPDAPPPITKRSYFFILISYIQKEPQLYKFINCG